jgi:hypothetical protein
MSQWKNDRFSGKMRWAVGSEENLSDEGSDSVAIMKIYSEEVYGLPCQDRDVPARAPRAA